MEREPYKKRIRASKIGLVAGVAIVFGGFVYAMNDIHETNKAEINNPASETMKMLMSWDALSEDSHGNIVFDSHQLPDTSSYAVIGSEIEIEQRRQKKIDDETDGLFNRPVEIGGLTLPLSSEGSAIAVMVGGGALVVGSIAYPRFQEKIERIKK